MDAFKFLPAILCSLNIFGCCHNNAMNKVCAEDPLCQVCREQSLQGAFLFQIFLCPSQSLLCPSLPLQSSASRLHDWIWWCETVKESVELRFLERLREASNFFLTHRIPKSAKHESSWEVQVLIQVSSANVQSRPQVHKLHSKLKNGILALHMYIQEALLWYYHDLLTNKNKYSTKMFWTHLPIQFFLIAQRTDVLHMSWQKTLI